MDLESVIQSEVREREKQIPYANTYIWNLKKNTKKRFLRTMGQNRNKDADVENGLDMGRGKGKLG